MPLKNLYEAQQLSKEIIFSLFKDADDLRTHPEAHKEDLKGKIAATLFYEPSTRTRLSFETAMMKLGGNVVSTENAKEFSSAIKGESLQDTIRVISAYCDCIIMRHYEEGAAKIASEVTEKPIINAGYGKGQHPTQALLDLYTVYREIGKIDEIKVDIKDYLMKHGIKFREENNLNSVLPIVDVIYMTRIQKERIGQEDYEKASGKFFINESNFNLIPKKSIVLHPLPHVDEIDLSIQIESEDSRVAYFRQVENGLYIRMALLRHLLL